MLKVPALSWLFPDLSDKNYFVESIFLGCSISRIKNFIEAQFDRNLIQVLRFSIIIRICTSSFFLSWKTRFNIFVGVISYTVRVEISNSRSHITYFSIRNMGPCKYSRLWLIIFHFIDWVASSYKCQPASVQLQNFNESLFSTLIKIFDCNCTLVNFSYKQIRTVKNDFLCLKLMALW